MLAIYTIEKKVGKIIFNMYYSDIDNLLKPPT